MWQDTLKMLVSERKVLFVGVGNSMMGDDGVGVFLAKLLSSYVPVCDVGERPEDVLSWDLGDIDTVIFMDACAFGGKPGDVILLKAEDTKERFLYSHRVPISIVASLLEGVEVYVLGVEPQSISPGEGLSCAVETAAFAVKDLVRDVSCTV